MQNSLIDYSDDNLQKGFRLQRLEVFNWGTFNQKVWKIELFGFNSLLTGDIGSGKSTLVDAIITLLVPYQKITYNKAAGVEAKERTLLSYVLGEYKNQRSELNNNSSPVFIRTDKDYSVLLGRFFNKGYETGLTLAQVFWVKNGKVEKFFVISKKDLNIKEHFSLAEDDRDILPMKKRIKGLEDSEIFENFRDYSIKFRSVFGIKSEKVLELFYQTVSMKSVGKLTEFMRNHMLEKPDVKDNIEEIKRNYENLTRSYEAVQRAKKQLEQLRPIIEDINNFHDISNRIAELKTCLEYLPFYFARKKYELLEKAIMESIQEKDFLIYQIDKKSEILNTLRERESEVSISISQNKEGQRIQQLEKEINEIEKRKELKFKKEKEYTKLCGLLELSYAYNAQTFEKSIQQAFNLSLTTENDLIKISEERDITRDLLARKQEEYDIYKTELDSLNKRKTKIPDKNLKIRDLILENCGLENIELPFVGELVQVKTNEKEWEGALERLLHNFGLSILVSEKYYGTISNYVDCTNLKGLLVYYRVSGFNSNLSKKEPEKSSLINKLEIKTDSEFYKWIGNELLEKFDYVCCESIELFQRENKAITKNGHIKGSRGRHEKDDRRNIYDKREYILGWNNQEKIESIRNQMIDLKSQIQKNADKLKLIEDEKNSLEKRKIHIHDFLKFKDFDEINWKKDAELIEKLKADVNNLKRASDKLKLLKEQLESIKREIENIDTERSNLESEKGRIAEKIDDYKEKSQECKSILAKDPFEKKQDVPNIMGFLKDENYNIKSVDKTQENITNSIIKKKEEIEKQKNDLSHSIVVKMQRFKNDYPAETIEIASSIDAISEYVAIYDKIKKEDLPKYEDNFKQLLNEGTINDIAIFKNQLDINAKNIERNIRAINESLKTIEYNTDTYIELLSDNVQDIEVKDFKIQLRNCLENTLGEKNLYSEEKFNQVKKILDRFNGGNQADINWTNKVTDVRNWFTFSAVEKYLIDNMEKEFYSDSSGKSGGQKEKLAYTILASALAYQFGPAGDIPKSRSFRFVVIDEAFGRGSDESTRYGLELFKKLNLQLLIITPLQKIHIIENYINYVHFVSNEDGNNSVVRDIPIEEYQVNKMIL
jgi:uncharacterized protein YPO0396